MMEAVLTPSFASSSSAAQLHEFTFNKLPSLHTSVKSSSWGIRKQYALLISLSVFIWLTCNRLGQPHCLDDVFKSIRVGFLKGNQGMTCFHTPLRSPLRPLREKDWTPVKDQSKTQKMHRELLQSKQQNQEDHPHHSDSQWVVVSTDWLYFNLTSFFCLQQLIEWIYCIHKSEQKQKQEQRSWVGNHLSLRI